MTADDWDPQAFLEARYADVQVITATLPDRVLGCVDHQKRIIWLAEGLTEVQARSVLAYEIAELQQGPAPSDPRLAAAHRRDAEDWAAMMLISSEDLVYACRTGQTVPEVALVLGVDTQTVRARFRGMTNAEQDAVMEALTSAV